MKKALVSIAVLAVALIAVSAFAFNIPGAPSSVDSAVKKATDVGVKEAARDKIRNCPCEFPNASATSGATCCGQPFEKFVSDLGGLKGINDMAGNRMYIRAEVQGANYDLRSARDTYVERELEKINQWYRVSVNNRKGSSKKISINVQ